MRETKVANITDVDVNNILSSKLVKTKNNSKCFIGHLDRIKKQLVLILSKMSEYVKTFKVRDGDKDLDWSFKKYVYTNFRALNVPEDNIECEFFVVISIDSLLV